MNIGKLLFVWIGVVLSFVLILTMLIITMTPGLGYEPWMLIFDIVTFLGWGVLVGFTIYALILSGRAISGSATNLSGKVTSIWLWCCLAIASVFFLSSFAGFTGQVIMIIAAILSVIGWGFFIYLCIRALIKARGSISSQNASSISLVFFLFTIFCISSGSLLTFGYFAACGPAWLSKIYHWYGVTGSVMGLAASYTFARLSGNNSFMGRASRITLTSITYALPPLLWLILWIVLGHSIQGTYPAKSSSPYLLPYPAGVSSWVVQGNNSNMSHSKSADKYAYDFRLSCGVDVLASRSGTVTTVTDTNSGSYATSNANRIIVRHNSDNSTAHYLHIEKGSAKVSVGDSVSQGTKLATTGNVGKSVTSHIHFEVKDSSGTEIPVSFKDAQSSDGIPRSFRSYRSNNK